MKEGGDGISTELFQILKDGAVKVLHSICQQIWKAQKWPQDWKRSVFIPIPKKGNDKECSNIHTIALISHASKFSSVTQLCLTLCNPMDYSMLGSPVHHQLPEFIQNHVHWVSDAIQPSHSLSSPSHLAFNLSQHQGHCHFESGGKSIGISTSASVLPMNIKDWSPSGWTGWITLQSKGLPRPFPNITVKKNTNFSAHSFLYIQLSHPYMTTGKTIAVTRWTFVGKVMSLLFNKLSRLVVAFLPRNKRLLISWLQSPFAVILEPKKIKSVMVSVVPPWSDGTRCHDLNFMNVECKPTFSLYSFKFIKRLFTSSSLSAIRVSSWTPYCQIQT